MANEIKEKSLFSMGLTHEENVAIISNIYFNNYLNAKWLLKIFKPQMIEESKPGEKCKDVYLQYYIRRCSSLLYFENERNQFCPVNTTRKKYGCFLFFSTCKINFMIFPLLLFSISLMS